MHLSVIHWLRIFGVNSHRCCFWIRWWAYSAYVCCLLTWFLWLLDHFTFLQNNHLTLLDVKNYVLGVLRRKDSWAGHLVSVRDVVMLRDGWTFERGATTALVRSLGELPSEGIKFILQETDPPFWEGFRKEQVCPLLFSAFPSCHTTSFSRDPHMTPSRVSSTAEDSHCSRFGVLWTIVLQIQVSQPISILH